VAALWVKFAAMSTIDRLAGDLVTRGVRAVTEKANAG
jgi:hypothetical protein